jgi:hypothetical protein
MQEVEYYIESDPDAPTSDAGILVRALDRNLLGNPREATEQEELLAGVTAIEVEFFDGNSWIDSWSVADPESELPVGVRVRIRQDGDKTKVVPPLEVVVPWPTQRTPK